MDRNGMESTLLLPELKVLVAQVLGLADPDLVGNDAGFGTTPGWDSFAHLMMITAVEDAYGLRTGVNEIDRTLTLIDLASFLAGEVAEVETVLDMTKGPLAALWRDDPLRDRDVIYVHARWHSRWQAARGEVGSLAGLLHWLRGPDGGRTVVVPAFPFTGRDYASVLTQRRPFSVIATPARTGLFAEMVRTTPEAVRSAHPLLSECALGPQAAWIVADAHRHPHPFHDGSTYARLLAADAAMVGLGVDIATNALIHLVDDRLGEHYPFPLYDAPAAFDVTFADGQTHPVTVLPYSPGITRRIRPRALRPFLAERPEILTELSVAGLPFYRLRLRPFIDLCTDIGSRALDAGRLPPWHEEE